MRLAKQSVQRTEGVKEEWLGGTFYEATIKYDSLFRHPWLHAQRVLHMGHETCFLQDLSAPARKSCMICTHLPRVFNTSRSEKNFKFKEDKQQLAKNQAQSAEAKAESLDCQR